MVGEGVQFMMEKKKVLVFPAGTEIAFEIWNALKNCKDVELWGATSVHCHAEMVFERCFMNLPFIDDDRIIDSLNNIIDEAEIDYIYPAHDSALFKLTRYKWKLHAEVITSDFLTVRICRNKNETYKYLWERGAYYLPRFYTQDELAFEDVDEFPVFAKPAVGQGAEGAVKVNSEEELQRLLDSGKEYAVCEYLPGEEITVDCFTDKNGTLRYVGQRSRDRIRSGIAVRSRTMPTEKIVFKIAEDLNDQFDFTGAWFFQMKKDKNGDYKLMEVAPRIAGTMGLTRNLGVNMPLLTLYTVMGLDVEIVNNNADLLLDRAFISRFWYDIDYDTVYVDFDDTLIVNGKVNPMLIAFLHQCKDKGKSVILLTKHRHGNIITDIEAHNISMKLFDAVILIGLEKEKADYVSEGGIFIDDSWRNRKKVQDKVGIPVFDVDAVESLLDWSA